MNCKILKFFRGKNLYDSNLNTINRLKGCHIESETCTMLKRLRSFSCWQDGGGIWPHTNSASWHIVIGEWSIKLLSMRLPLC